MVLGKLQSVQQVVVCIEQRGGECGGVFNSNLNPYIAQVFWQLVYFMKCQNSLLSSCLTP